MVCAHLVVCAKNLLVARLEARCLRLSRRGRDGRWRGLYRCWSYRRRCGSRRWSYGCRLWLCPGIRRCLHRLRSVLSRRIQPCHSFVNMCRLSLGRLLLHRRLRWHGIGCVRRPARRDQRHKEWHCESRPCGLGTTLRRRTLPIGHALRIAQPASGARNLPYQVTRCDWRMNRHSPTRAAALSTTKVRAMLPSLPAARPKSAKP